MSERRSETREAAFFSARHREGRNFAAAGIAGYAARVRALPFAVVVLLATSSCLQIPNVLAPGSPVDFCIEQAKVYCQLQFDCCTATERTEDPLGIFSGPAVSRWAPSTIDECVGIVSDICRGEVEQQNESLADERVKYDSDEAASCLDDLHKAADDCSLKDFLKADGSYLTSLVQNGQPGIFGAACEDTIKGEVDDGDTCFAQYECKRGFCSPRQNGDVTLKGECSGDTHPENPFATFGNITLEVCNGLDDEANP